MKLPTLLTLKATLLDSAEAATLIAGMVAFTAWEAFLVLWVSGALS